MSSAYDRLLDGVSEVSAEHGYADLTVEKVLAATGVSRASFYQHFLNADDCFWSAYRHHADRLVSRVSDAVVASREREPAALEALAEHALAHPQIARLLMREGLAAGAPGLGERDTLIARIAHAIAGPAGTSPSSVDLPAALLVGATLRFLSMRLSDGSRPGELGAELREWAQSFTRECSQPSLSARFTPRTARGAGHPPARANAARQRGNTRERILHATAATIREKGYRDMTVGDIVESARTSRRSFYNEFTSKQDAFTAAYQHGFEQTLAACAPAFFTPREWPERVWHGAQAFSAFLAREQPIAHLGLVECYAAGPSFARRAHDTQLAFTLFLEEGYRQRPEAQTPSRACSTLTAAAIFELAFQSSRQGAGPYLQQQLPLAVFITLTPFIGRDAAGEFVTDKMRERAAAIRPAA